MVRPRSIAYLFLLGLPWGAPAWSQVPPEPCPADCTLYESFRAPLRLLMDSLPVRSGVRQTDPERRPFAHRTFDEIMAREQALEMWEAIPPECRRAVLGTATPQAPDAPNVEFIARLRADTLALSLSDRAFQSGARSAYASLQAIAGTPCFAQAEANAQLRAPPGASYEQRAEFISELYVNCARDYQGLIESEMDQVLSLSADQVNGLIRARWGDSSFLPPTLTESNMQVFRAFHEFFRRSNSGEALQFLEREARRMTFDQKMLFLQMVGGQMAEHYDYGRMDRSITESGPVTLEQIFQSSRTTVRLGAHSGIIANTPEGTFDVAGVCRDIASAQGQLARAMGIRNAYVVSYAVDNTFHTSLYVRNPERPDQVYHVNYGDAALRQAGDSRALQSGSWDQALVYRIAQPGGRSVMSTASEFGRFLSEAAGLDPSTTDPLSRIRTQLIAADIPLVRSGADSVRIGVAEDGIGDRHAFVGVSDSWGQRTIAPGRAGLVAGVRVRETPPDPLNPSRVNVLSYIAFAIEQHLRPEIRLDEDTTLYSDTSIHGLAMVGPDTTVGIQGARATFDGDLRIRQEVGVQHQFGRGSVRARAGVILSPGTLDIRDMSAPIVPILDHAYGAAEARVPVSPDLLAFAYTMVVVHDEFVARGRAEAGIESSQLSLSLGVEGNLGEWSGTDPGFLEGSRRRAIASFVLNPVPELTIRFGGAVDLEENEQGEHPITGTGSVEGRF